MVYILAIVSIALGSVGQFLLKLAAGNLQTGNGILQLAFSFLNIRMITAVSFFVTSMVMWIFVLRKLELSIAYPMVSLGYIFVMIISVLLLHEQIYLNKILGTGLIMAGVVVLNIK